MKIIEAIISHFGSVLGFSCWCLFVLYWNLCWGARFLRPQPMRSVHVFIYYHFLICTGAAVLRTPTDFCLPGHGDAVSWPSCFLWKHTVGLPVCGCVIPYNKAFVFAPNWLQGFIHRFPTPLQFQRWEKICTN